MIEFTFDHLLEVVGAEKYPILARAAQNVERAMSTRVCWRNADGEEEWNACQIVRVPYAVKGEDAGVYETDFSQRPHPEQLLSFLDTVESILHHGTRRFPEYAPGGHGYRPAWCGGVLELLGREPRETDTLKLRELRSPRVRWWSNPGGSVDYEWIAEFSLEAVAANHALVV